MFFKSLKQEILALTLGLTILTIVITTVLGVSSTQTAGTDAGNATSNVLREQSKQSLLQITKGAAEQQDLVFQKVRSDASNLASFTAGVLEHPDAYASNAYWTYDTRVFKRDGKYLNAESDVSSIFIPDYVVVDAKEKQRINLTAQLDFIAPSVLASSPDSVAVYTIDDKGFSRYFPNIVLGNVAPPDHSTLDDPVYVQGTPKEDPGKAVVWSPLYDDPAERGLMITTTAPIYTSHGFEGVIGIDVLLNNIITTITAYSPINGSYAFLIDKNGTAVAFPDKAYRDILGRDRTEGEVKTNLASSSSEFLPILEDMKKGNEGFGSIHSAGRTLSIAYAPLHQTGFSLGVVAEESVLLQAVGTLHTEISKSVQNNILLRIVPASILIILIASLIGVVLVARTVRPIQLLTKGAEAIGSGDLDYTISVRSKNEIGTLASSFNQMSRDLKKSHAELEEYSHGLEEKVKERTKSLAEANTRQEGLLHFISHEIKGYLTEGQNAFAGIVEGDYGAISMPIKSLAETALARMRDGVSTVMNILDASNLKKGTVAYKKESFDFRATVEEAVETLRAKATGKKLTLEYTVDGNAPYQFVGDKEKIAEHVLRNLIDNAIRYTPQGSIHVSLTHSGKAIRFSVKDTGVGITDEDRPRLFTEGGHGKDSIKVNVDSTGYGLFIAKQVTEAHGGTIRAESAGAGKGSEFVVELPTN